MYLMLNTLGFRRLFTENAGISHFTPTHSECTVAVQYMQVRGVIRLIRLNIYSGNNDIIFSKLFKVVLDKIKSV